MLYALAERAGTDRQQLEKLRMAKAEERGGFADRIIWSGNQPAAGPGEGTGYQLHHRVPQAHQQS